MIMQAWVVGCRCQVELPAALAQSEHIVQRDLSMTS